MPTVEEQIITIQSAIADLEEDIGINPGGAYANARVRLDILESRIDNPNAPAPDVEDPFTIGNNGVEIYTGIPHPDGSIIPTPTPGSLYIRTGGDIGEGLYQVRGDNEWHSISIGLSGYDVSSEAPQDGYALIFNDGYGDGTWEAQRLAVIFDPLHDTDTTNIISNKFNTQSPIPADGYTGIINFGSDTDQSTNGTAANYAVILGGNKNEVRSDYGVVIGGSEGVARYPHQHIHSARSLTSNLGDSQYSRLILDGYADSGVAFNLTTPGVLDGYLSLEEDKYYDMCIRVLVVSTDGTEQSARFIRDVLVHVNGGVITIDNMNNTLTTQNGTDWAITITFDTNDLIISVDAEGSPGTDRRAIATVEWRELAGA